MNVTTKIEGLNGLAAALADAPSGVRKLLSRMMEESVQRVVRDARGFAPRDKGDLRRAIGYAGSRLTWRAGVHSEKIASRGPSRTHMDPAIYGQFVERGTGRTAAQPFMRPAAQAEEARLAQALREVAAQLADVVAKKSSQPGRDSRGRFLPAA